MISTDVLSAPQRAAVDDLLAAVTAHDGVPPLDEAARLAQEAGDAEHLLIAPAQQAGPDATEPAEIVGYTSILADGTVQGMVHPRHRRRGHGTAMLTVALDRRPDAGVWAHGALEASLAFLTAHGLRESRRLLTLHRRLDAERPLPPVRPAALDGLHLGTFEADRDAEDWLAVNAAAFADHPEQGTLRREDLDQRMAEPWFDPEDLLLARHRGELVGFVWIKREAGTADAEIYVIGTAPSVQGRGVASMLLGAALRRLQEAGVGGVELFVEGDNTSAVALYERWGFTVSGQHVQLRTTGA